MKSPEPASLLKNAYQHQLLQFVEIVNSWDVHSTIGCVSVESSTQNMVAK